MKFKIAKSYKIMGRRIRIKMVETNEWAGMYDHEKKIIFISVNQSDRQKIETVFHEIIHCIQYSTAINQAVSRELLEVMAETTSQEIVSILLDKKFIS